MILMTSPHNNSDDMIILMTPHNDNTDLKTAKPGSSMIVMTSPHINSDDMIILMTPHDDNFDLKTAKPASSRSETEVGKRSVQPNGNPFQVDIISFHLKKNKTFFCFCAQ